MTSVLAVASAVQGAAVLATALAAAAVLVLRDPRLRAAAMLATLALSVLAVATLEGDSLGRHPAAVAGAAGAGLVAIVILAAVLYRRPHLIGLLALGAIPFRVPLPLGAETASLLVPLYGVIAAGALAEAARWLRRGRDRTRSRSPRRRATGGCGSC